MPHLKSFIEHYKYCQIHMPSHPKEPLIPTEAPLYPFQMVAADYFEVGTRTHHYLVYVDRSQVLRVEQNHVVPAR